MEGFYLGGIMNTPLRLSHLIFKLSIRILKLWPEVPENLPTEMLF